MNSLRTIQKIFQVFKTLSKIGMIASFIWAVFTAIGLLCGVIWHSGATVTGPCQEALLSLALTGSLNQIMGDLLSDMVFALADGILLLSAFRYFRQELADGTPFTQSGAEQIKRLGLCTIVLPLAAAILSAVFYEVFALPQAALVDQSNLSSITLGIVMMLAPLIFRYGAELEEKNGICNQMLSE